MALIRTFWVDDGLGSLVTLHQTIALVDCKSFTSKLNCDDIVSRLEDMNMEGDSEFPESELLIRQLIYADKIILNKTDLVASSELIEDIKRVIYSLNPQAEVVLSQYSQVGIDFVINKQVSSETKVIPKDTASHDHHHDGADTCMLHGCKGSSKLSDIQSIYLKMDCP